MCIFIYTYIWLPCVRMLLVRWLVRVYLLAHRFLGGGYRVCRCCCGGGVLTWSPVDRTKKEVIYLFYQKASHTRIRSTFSDFLLSPVDFWCIFLLTCMGVGDQSRGSRSSEKADTVCVVLAHSSPFALSLVHACIYMYIFIHV